MESGGSSAHGWSARRRTGSTWDIRGTHCWVRGRSTPENAGVTLERVIDHIDHICQIAGNARHCMIGSDLDGAFGREQCPADVETIADLQKMPGLLRKRGYSEDDVANIAHGNFIGFLRSAWS